MSSGLVGLFEDRRREGSTTSDWFTSLAEAQEVPDSILVIEGLEHGYILLTCPARLIRARELSIGLLAADLHAVSFLLDGLAEHDLSLWLERHNGGRRVRGWAAGKARLAHGPWLLNPWGWRGCSSPPSSALRAEVDAVLLEGKPRVDAGVLQEEREARLEVTRAARLGARDTEEQEFFAARGWDYDVCEPPVAFDLDVADAERLLTREWARSRA